MRRTLSVFWLVLVACGEGPDFVDRDTKVVFAKKSLADDFWAVPLPSDLRQAEFGSLGLSKWPGARDNGLVDMWLSAADERLSAWGVSSGVFVRTNKPIAVASLPSDAAASLAADASVYLLDVDPDSPRRGERLPVRVSFRPDADLFCPENLIAAVPLYGATRRANTTYALVVTDRVQSQSGEPLGASESFFDAWWDKDDADAALAKHLAPLRETLAKNEREHVVGAAVFSTLDPDAQMQKLAAFAEAQPLPAQVGGWMVAQTYPDFQLLTSNFTLPVIQRGSRPYTRAPAGDIVWDDSGEVPVIQSTQDVRVVVSIPRTPQPAAGFPLTLYLHGSGGNWYEGIDRGPLPEVPRDEAPNTEPGTGPAAWLARRGIATMGFDFPLHGNRYFPPDTSGLLLYNLFGNITATIDNFHVAAMEVLLWSRLAQAITIDAALADTLDAGSAEDGMIRFDPARLSGMGHSMGSTLGTVWAAYDPRAKAMVLSGAGGVLVRVALGAHTPIDLKPFVEGLLSDADAPVVLTDDYPLLHAFQNLWDLVDPVAKIHHLVKEPLPGIPRKHVLLPAGHRDGYFDPEAQAAMALGLGAPIVGEAVDPTVPSFLAVAGIDPITYPVHGNLDGYTAAVLPTLTQYELGHYIVFDRPELHYQVGCFLDGVSEGETPVVPAPSSDEAAPCP